MTNIYVIKYNNYFNRIVKRESSLTDYLTGEYQISPNYSFNPNDDATGDIVVNFNPKGDYLIVANDDEIVSRWFIIEAIRLRTGQYKLTIRRDVIVDDYDTIVNSPIFIEKATANVNDPLIFNSENMSFNQIKKSETLLKDETNCPWIVGYIPRDFKSDGVTITYPLTGSQDFTVEKLSDWKYYNYIGTNKGSLQNAIYAVYVKAEQQMISAGLNSNGTVYNLPYYEPSGQVGNIPTPSLIANGLTFVDPYLTLVALNQYRNEVFNGVSVSDLNSQLSNEQGLSTDLNPYLQSELNNKILLDKSSNTYYRITVTNTYKEEITNFSNININRNIPGVEITGTAQTGNFKVQFAYYEVTIKLEQAYEKAFVRIPENRYHLNDQPYDMFCMPFSDDLEIYKNGTLQLKANKNLALSIGTSIGSMVGSTGIYDVQLLPYCPVRYCIQDDGKFDFKDAIVTDIIRDDQAVKPMGYIFWANTSTFTFDIKKSLKIKYPRLNTIRKSKASSIDSNGTFIIDLSPYIGEDELFKFSPITATPHPYKSFEFDGAHKTATFTFDTQYANKSEVIVFDLTFKQPVTLTATDIKVANECDKYRLCSPNYNGQFEFNLAKNGDVNYFNVDCSYKPFNPYIHVNPEFGGLYGRDFNDARGLICSGDFSLPQITSAWANYEANNKNYENIFNRQIQNLEISQNNQRLSDIVGGISSAATVGMGAGLLAGGPVGAAVGIGSAASGVADYFINENNRKEQMSYTKDMYSYNLQNIKAIPYSLTKVSAINSNNKLYPFIEYYTCTDEEKDALINKLKYDGMTIMKIGTINQYLHKDKTFIKGMLIRVDLHKDSNYINNIYNELMKGVYI